MKILAFIASTVVAAFLCSPVAAAPKYGDWPGDDEPGTIVIITGDHTLHYIEDYGKRISFPIAVGKEGMKWYGETRVTGQKANPDWRPTPDMRKKNPKLPEVMKGGPGNPLGVRAIYLAEGYLRIHGNNDPKSIGKDASSGCFRMLNEDVTMLGDIIKTSGLRHKVLVLP